MFNIQTTNLNTSLSNVVIVMNGGISFIVLGVYVISDGFGQGCFQISNEK